jgi:hypothetical protein
MKKKNTNSVMIGLKITEEIKELLLQQANIENRTLSNYLNIVLIDHLRKKNLLPGNKAKKF